MVKKHKKISWYFYGVSMVLGFVLSLLILKQRDGSFGSGYSGYLLFVSFSQSLFHGMSLLVCVKQPKKELGWLGNQMGKQIVLIGGWMIGLSFLPHLMATVLHKQARAIGYETVSTGDLVYILYHVVLCWAGSLTAVCFNMQKKSIDFLLLLLTLFHLVLTPLFLMGGLISVSYGLLVFLLLGLLMGSLLLVLYQSE